MDMEGRSLGTERPPTSTSPGAGPDGATTARGRFSELLGTRTSAAADPARGAVEEAVDDVTARIRDGRTDAADQVRRRDAAVRDGQEVRDGRANERREDASRQDARAAEASGSDRRSVEFRERSEASSGRASARPSGRDRSTGWTDASEAEGATIEPEEATEAPYGGPLQAQAPPPAGIAASNPGGAGAPTLPAAVTRATGQGAPVPASGAGPARPPAAAALGGTRVDAAPPGPTSKAAPARPGGSLQRAEAILEQVRVRIQSGEREATINLNPADMGRVRLRVRVSEGAVQASIAAESAETLAVLEAHAPELRAWLGRDGAESVEVHLELMTSAEADEHSRFDRHGGGEHQGTGGRERAPDLAGAAAPEGLLRQLATRAADGGVDLIA